MSIYTASAFDYILVTTYLPNILNIVYCFMAYIFTSFNLHFIEPCLEIIIELNIFKRKCFLAWIFYIQIIWIVFIYLKPSNFWVIVDFMKQKPFLFWVFSCEISFLHSKISNIFIGIVIENKLSRFWGINTKRCGLRKNINILIGFLPKSMLHYCFLTSQNSQEFRCYLFFYLQEELFCHSRIKSNEF